MNSYEVDSSQYSLLFICLLELTNTLIISCHIYVMFNVIDVDCKYVIAITWYGIINLFVGRSGPPISNQTIMVILLTADTLSH